MEEGDERIKKGNNGEGTRGKANKGERRGRKGGKSEEDAESGMRTGLHLATLHDTT